jgi:hypothetical protein
VSVRLHGLVPLLLAAMALPSPARAQGGTPSGRLRVIEESRIDARRAIDFHAALSRDTVFVGQQATYQVAVFLSEDARSRLRRNPELLPPELRGLLAYEIGAPLRIAPQDIGGQRYEAHVFQRALFPVAPGTLLVPSPQLSYALPQSSSYFSREERFVVRAESAQLVVRPLPTDGRPPGFTGAVGRFALSVRLDTSRARVGDPLVVTMRVAGTGNVKLLTRPVLDVPWADAVEGPERMEVDTSTTIVRGAREFDWILTPRRSGRLVLPVQGFSYFDPDAARYAVARTVERTVEVAPGVILAPEEDEDGAALTLRPWRLRGDGAPGAASGGAVPDDGRPAAAAARHGVGAALPPWGWLLLLLVPAPAVWWWLRGSGRARRRDASAAATPGAAHAPKATADAGTTAVRRLRRTVYTELAARLGVDAQGLVDRRRASRLLRRCGVTAETANQALELLADLDHASFGGGSAGARDRVDALERRAADVTRHLDAEAIGGRSSARTRSRPDGTASVATAIALSVALLAIGDDLRAQSPRAATAPATIEAAAAFDSAVADYAQRRYGASAAKFTRLAHAWPTDPDLLVNWGTAAWAAGDTVDAVIAWQRAARLDPFATDVQERLALLPAGASGGVAEVPMVPVRPLVFAAAAAWCVAWLLLTLVAHDRARLPVRIRAADASDWRVATGGLLLLAALVGTGAAWWTTRRLEGRELAVVTRTATMRAAPGSDAEAVGGVATGDVVRIEATRNDWQRVAHADGRVGWLPQGRLRALTDAPDDR